MRCTGLSAILLLCGSAALAAPTPEVTLESGHDNFRSTTELEVRAAKPKSPAPITGGRGGSASELGAIIAQTIQDAQAALREDQDKENHLVGELVNRLIKENPEKNVLVYHDQRSKLENFQGTHHEHIEVEERSRWQGSTKGYEIILLDSGIFTLAGDAGWLNVGYGGCFRKTDNPYRVEFKKRNPCAFDEALKKLATLQSNRIPVPVKPKKHA